MLIRNPLIKIEAYPPQRPSAGVRKRSNPPHWPKYAVWKQCVLWCLFLCAQFTHAQLSREQNYIRAESGRFRVIYCPEDEGVIPSVITELNLRIPFVERQLGASLGDTVGFVITPTEQEWNRVTAGAPLWAHGIAFPGRGIAVLKSPRFGLPYGPLPTTAIHEYVHILLSAITHDQGIPRWFDEGVAQLAAGQLDYMDQQVVARAAGARRLHTFQNLQGLMSMSALEARQGYAESLLAAQLLQSKFGWSGLSNLLHGIHASQSFEEAFPRVFGQTTTAFERDFRAHIEHSFGRTLLADTDLWVSGLFVVLILAAGVVVFQRRKRTLARWTEDEHPPANPDNLSVAPPYTVNYELLRSRQEEGGEPEDPNQDIDPEQSGNR
jgi:hypothetical protein